jgi:hypothetical protein
VVRGVCGGSCASASSDCDSRSKAGEEGDLFVERDGRRHLNLPQTRNKKVVIGRKNCMMLWVVFIFVWVWVKAWKQTHARGGYIGRYGGATTGGNLLINFFIGKTTSKSGDCGIKDSDYSRIFVMWAWVNDKFLIGYFMSISLFCLNNCFHFFYT